MKRTPLKRSRKPLRQRSKNKLPKIKRELDSLWSIIIKLRDKCCALCGNTNHLNAHHCIVPKKRSLAIRWELQNGIALCSYCHMRVHHCHKAQLDEYMSILNKRIPYDDQQALIAKANAGQKFCVSELEELKDRLQMLVNDSREAIK